MGLRALLKGPTAVQILSWPQQGSNHRPCGSKSISLTTMLQAAHLCLVVFQSCRLNEEQLGRAEWNRILTILWEKAPPCLWHRGQEMLESTPLRSLVQLSPPRGLFGQHWWIELFEAKTIVFLTQVLSGQLSHTYHISHEWHLSFEKGVIVPTKKTGV